MVSKSDSRFYFVQDGDAGLSKAFLAAFAPEVRAGATLLHDSDPAAEYQETLNKARGLLMALEITEARAS